MKTYLQCFNFFSLLVLAMSYEMKVLIPNGGLIFGDIITIQGNPNSAGSFAINFKVSNGDTALHLRPNFLNWMVYRNGYVGKMWGERETFGSFPFRLNQNFTMTILVDTYAYMIAVDGVHFTAFTHRVKPSDVNEIETWGDIDYLDIEVTKGPRPVYPHPVQPSKTPQAYIHQPAMPFMGKIPGVLDAPRKIRIWAKVLTEMEAQMLPREGIHNSQNLHLESFELNLQEGPAFIHDNRHRVAVGLRLTVMLKENPKELVLSAHVQGDTYEGKFPCDGFSEGGDFLLDILVQQGTYEVRVNDVFCGELDHIIPVQIIDHIFATGTIKLHSVHYA